MQLKKQASQSQLRQQVLQSDNKCVCQICTCGHHHCPQTHIAFKGETTNHHDYKQYNIAVQKSQKCVYKLNQSRYDPQLLKSTYQVNYRPVKGQQNQLRPHYAYQTNTNKFYDETEYRKSFVQNKIAVEKPIFCSNKYTPSTGKFYGTTSYEEQFNKKTVVADQRKNHYAYQKNELPFYGQTTYGETFKQYPIQVERPQTCQGKYFGNPAHFEGKSSYRQQFQPHQIHRDRRCLIEELPCRPRECSPGKNHVHYSANKNRWD